MKKNKHMNNPRDLINLWERLELKLSRENKTSSFISRIEEIDKEAMIIEQPVRIDGDLDLSVGQRLEAVFNREDASYTFDAVITGIDTSRDNIVILQAISDVRRSQRRRFVRIDINGNIAYKTLEINKAGNKTLSLEKTGELLNISAGGILMTTSDSLNQDEIVLLNFSLKNSQRLENILGVTKRLDKSQNPATGREEILVGIEFFSREKFEEKYAFDINECLPSDVKYFTDALQQAIVQFVYKQQVAGRKKTKVTT